MTKCVYLNYIPVLGTTVDGYQKQHPEKFTINNRNSEAATNSILLSVFFFYIKG